MAERASNDKGRRALLSQEALPKIEIPRAVQRARREFKLPDSMRTPLPERTVRVDPDPKTEPEAEPDDADATGPRFRARTMDWFERGEELTLTSETVAPEPETASKRPLVVAVVAAVAVAAALTLAWAL